jgi:nitroimidazol reductase NimA-like FMN-containing flavoprotein (pyridoxamine 5'-phosphate oxidase superfamily)
VLLACDRKDAIHLRECKIPKEWLARLLSSFFLHLTVKRCGTVHCPIIPHLIPLACCLKDHYFRAIKSSGELLERKSSSDVSILLMHSQRHIQERTSYNGSAEMI